jgi:hypothetical protein
MGMGMRRVENGEAFSTRQVQATSLFEAAPVGFNPSYGADLFIEATFQTNNLALFPSLIWLLPSTSTGFRRPPPD